MMISTRGRYAIRILLYLAQHGEGGKYVPMREVAEHENISLKYIEKIMPVFKPAGLVDSTHGIGGGYRLTKDPSEYPLWEILLLTEGDLAPVSCLQENKAGCNRSSECKTLPVWQKYYQLTEKFFSSISLADLMDKAE